MGAHKHVRQHIAEGEHVSHRPVFHAIPSPFPLPSPSPHPSPEPLPDASPFPMMTTETEAIRPVNKLEDQDKLSLITPLF